MIKDISNTIINNNNLHYCCTIKKARVASTQVLQLCQEQQTKLQYIIQLKKINF